MQLIHFETISACNSASCAYKDVLLPSIITIYLYSSIDVLIDNEHVNAVFLSFDLPCEIQQLSAWCWVVKAHVIDAEILLTAAKITISEGEQLTVSKFYSVVHLENAQNSQQATAAFEIICQNLGKEYAPYLALEEVPSESFRCRIATYNQAAFEFIKSHELIELPDCNIRVAEYLRTRLILGPFPIGMEPRSSLVMQEAWSNNVVLDAYPLKPGSRSLVLAIDSYEHVLGLLQTGNPN